MTQTLPYQGQSVIKCLEALSQLNINYTDLGLERITRILGYLNNPQDNFQSIHIVGTNGKGSLSSLLSAIYQQAGYQVGLFTSPHLVSPQERIQLNNQWLPESLWLKSFYAVQSAADTVLAPHKESLSYFEFLTAIAFYAFAQANVNVAVIEAGLGGRLDATNMFNKPLTIAITPISLDHIERLGSTLSAIASEKAAVIKPNSTVFCATQPSEALHIIQSVASAQQAVIYTASSRWQLGPITLKDHAYRRILLDSLHNHTLDSPRLSHFHSDTVNMAQAIIDQCQPYLPVTDAAFYKALQTSQWPCRFQWLHDTPKGGFILDGSHNPAGFQSLIRTLQSDFYDQPIHWLLSLTASRPLTWLDPVLQYQNTASITALSLPKEFTHAMHTAEAVIEHATHITSNTPLRVMDTQTWLSEPTPCTALSVVSGSLYSAGMIYSQLNP